MTTRPTPTAAPEVLVLLGLALGLPPNKPLPYWLKPSRIVAALAASDVYLVSRESLAAALRNTKPLLDSDGGFHIDDPEDFADAARLILEQIGEHSDAR